MKYKLKNGGILKLQTAGSVPRVKVTIPEDNTPTQISTTSVKPPIRETTKEEARELAKEQTIREHEDVINYNKEHGTNFYNIDQVIEHEKSTTGLNMPITVPAMYGTATTAYINQQYIPTVQSTLKNELANAVAILTTPLMAGEFAAGIVPGLIKIGAGLGTSYLTSKSLGAAGDWLDKKTNSNIYGPTGRFIGGFGGYALGSGAAGSALRWTAGNGITTGISPESFNILRSQYFANKYITTGNRYYGPNINKQWRQMLQDRYNRDKDLEQYVIYPNDAGIVIHADGFPTGVSKGRVVGGRTVSALNAPRITEKGMLEPAHTKITSYGPDKINIYTEDSHPLFWSLEGKPWYETLGRVSGEGGIDETYFFDHTLDPLKYIHTPKEVRSWKQNALRIGEYEQPYRYVLAKKSDLPNMKKDYHQGITSSAIPVDKTTIFEYNPLIRGFQRVQHVVPKPNKPGAFVLFERPSKLSTAESVGIRKADRPMWEMFPQVQENARMFAKEYGYPEPTTLSEIKDMYRRHNTFFRMVNVPERKYVKSIGDDFWNLPKEEQYKLLASKGYPLEMRDFVKDINPNGPSFQDEFVFVSPTLEENATYDPGLTKTVKLQRPFSFRDPLKWHIDSDWRPVYQTPYELWPKGKTGVGNSTPNRELKVSTKHLIPVDMAKPIDLGTLNGRYFSKRINEASNMSWWKQPYWYTKAIRYNQPIQYTEILPTYLETK